VSALSIYKESAEDERDIMRQVYIQNSKRQNVYKVIERQVRYVPGHPERTRQVRTVLAYGHSPDDVKAQFPHGFEFDDEMEVVH